MNRTVKNTGRLTCESTRFVNVDLDIFSRVSLTGLVDAMGEAALVLYVGGTGRKYEAHVELASSGHVGMTADRTIIGLTRLVKRLPPRYRKVWDSAKSREFNVGIEAGLEPHSFEVRLDRRTVDAVREVGGALVVTVYAPDIAALRR
ncbi:MAG TPA: hypothetical protein VNP73_07915 [Actinomycetota bacterium]|nr:hypothetical protein [Actinomycetota bacterium]